MQNVMIVDDEALVLLDLVHTVEDLGYAIHSESTSVEGALASLEGEAPDLALLDIDVAGVPVWPVARELTAKGVPVIFVSANLSHKELCQEFADCPKLEKPASPADIGSALEIAGEVKSCAA